MSKRSKLYIILMLLIIINTYLYYDSLNNKDAKLVNNTLVEFKQKKIVYEKKIGSIIGHLEIKNRVRKTPVYYGENEGNLNKGITLDESRGIPGINNKQSAFAGHRETFFKNLQHVKVGDDIDINILYKKSKYKIYKIDVVKDYEGNKVYIDKLKNELVLVTCYPFNSFSEPKERYIVYAKLI